MACHASPGELARAAAGRVLRYEKAARIRSRPFQCCRCPRGLTARGDQQRGAACCAADTRFRFPGGPSAGRRRIHPIAKPTCRPGSPGESNAPARQESLPDAELLSRHVSGDPGAFGELFRRHRDRLWAVAVNTLGDPDEAADAVQDAMIAAFRRAESFRGDSAVTTWLHSIVVNAALDPIRHRAACPTTGCQDEDALDALASGSQPPADPAGSSDTAIDVRAALQHLVPDQRAALVLVDMLGYSVADAARVLGVSEGTVKSRAARGRARLLPRLRHLRPGAAPGQTSGTDVPPAAQ